ncbi:UDP-N-acetylmuramoyl-L-alanyl-D-glutamate--2,6-diaminopimelate ligase [Thermodesulfobacteriota bacterium]
MKLSRIIKNLRVQRTTDREARHPVDPKMPENPRSQKDPDIVSIHYRAQEVESGGLFVAIPGLRADGHDYINEALARGAAAVIVQKPVQKDAILIQVGNTRKALAEASVVFYGKPTENLITIGITGTNGKTTTAFLVESILKAAGFKAGVIGTINYHYAGKTFDNPITTPESLDLQKILAAMLADGVTHAVMEVSSHAIDLFRIAGCQFDIGVFTNISRDHLDFHGNMHAYAACKKSFFTHILRSGPKKDKALAVINCEDTHGRDLSKTLGAMCVSVGRSAGSSIHAGDIRYALHGIQGKINTPKGSFDFASPLVGVHNLENILCATGVGFALGLELNTIKTGIEQVHAVPGRLECIPNDAGRFVYVDYAHTPDALEHVLTALKSLLSNRMICVFGCGGDRDKEKRPQMGEIAGKLCDLAIITSDNPRSENPAEIIDQILQGTKKTSPRGYSPADLSSGSNTKGYVVEPDRRKAIALGVALSRADDTVLIAGKGHETYQIIGKETLQFDDRQVAKEALMKCV